MIGIIRKILNKLDPETAHNIALKLIKYNPVNFGSTSDWNTSKDVMGLKFMNPIGLAAGFDKNGDCINGLFKLGFGFIELGTITPDKQDGNEKPRIFRINNDGSLINHMGLNNLGVKHLVKKLKKVKQKNSDKIIGVSIAKNNYTSNESAMYDYFYCMRKVFKYCDYIALNVSCPNVKSLKEFETTRVSKFIINMKIYRDYLEGIYNTSIKLAIKISPDLTKYHICKIVELAEVNRIDAIIATNTSLVNYSILFNEIRSGIPNMGLSGPQIKNKSLNTIRTIRDYTKNIAIIGCGGIMNDYDAMEYFDTGADLIQVLSGFVDQGIDLIHDINYAYYIR